MHGTGGNIMDGFAGIGMAFIFTFIFAIVMVVMR